MNGFFNNISDKIKKHYWNNLVIFDLVIAIILVFIIKLVIDYNLSADDLNLLIFSKTKDIYNIIATIAGTLLGFIITSISIIVAFTESDRLKILRNSKQYVALFKIYFNTIKVLAITTIIAIIGILTNPNNILWFYFIIILLIVSALLIWACIWALERIMDIVRN